MNIANQSKGKIFFIGIGGKGLNGIAKICLELGYEVAGVDQNQKPETAALEEMGAKIFYGHDRRNVDQSVDMVVYSSIISEDCPELVEANKLGIQTMKRSEFLGVLTKDDFRICVCGSHGKSTTTALVGLSMINSGEDATIFGGAYTKELQSYNHLGKSRNTVIEACEYDRSFHDLIGNISIFTSLEKSHLEYYKDEEEMNESFRYFCEQHPKNSIIIANGDNPKIRKVTSNISAKVVYFGFDKSNDYVIDEFIPTRIGSIFSMHERKSDRQILDQLNIKIPGTYNIKNFAATAVLLDILGIAISGVYDTAEHFTGVGRRFEIQQAASGHIFIDDFAHHPTQVKYLFDGVRQFFPHQKTCAIFQPRQFNLIKNFISEYGEAFKKADEVIVTDILSCLGDTEEDVKSLTTEEVADAIRKGSDKKVKVMNDFSEIVNYLDETYHGDDSVITTIGAGDVYKVRDQFIENYS